MSLISLFLLALALAADSFAASIAKGAQLYRPTIWQALLVAMLFGGVQVLMPLIGWQVGIEIQPLIESIDHWLAFGILIAIGGKMVFDGLRDNKDGNNANTFTIPALLLTAVATSIDALVIGFGFGFLNVSILVALVLIGAVTFFTSFGGVFLGKRLSVYVGDYAEIGAGVVLIILGSKILLEHTRIL